MVQSLPQSDGFRILFNSPELSEVQRSGFHLFLKKGIAEEISKISCIQIKTVNFLVEISIDAQNFRLVAPENNYRDCILKMKSYTCKLYVQAKTLFRDKISGELLYQTEPEWVLLADLPMMTKRGHFVINGSPRIVVHQVGRAPGIYFKKILKVKKEIPNQARFYGDIIPRKGVWVRLQISKKGEIDLKLKKSKKVRAEMVQKCLELLEKEEWIKTEQIYKKNRLNQSYNRSRAIKNQIHALTNSSFVQRSNKLLPESNLPKQSFGHSVKLCYAFTKAEKEAFTNVYTSFYKNEIQDLEERASIPLKPEQKDQTEASSIANGTDLHKHLPSPTSLFTELPVELKDKFSKKDVYVKTKSSHQSFKKKKSAKKQNIVNNLEKVREYLSQLFRRSDLYDLGPVGREKLNTKFGISVMETQLTALDIKEAINWLSKLRAGREETDDIDHSQNRRVRTSSELIQTQFSIGITRLKNLVTKKVRSGKDEQIKTSIYKQARGKRSFGGGELLNKALLSSPYKWDNKALFCFPFAMDVVSGNVRTFYVSQTYRAPVCYRNINTVNQSSIAPSSFSIQNQVILPIKTKTKFLLETLFPQLKVKQNCEYNPVFKHRTLFDVSHSKLSLTIVFVKSNFGLKLVKLLPQIEISFDLLPKAKAKSNHLYRLQSKQKPCSTLVTRFLGDKGIKRLEQRSTSKKEVEENYILLDNAFRFKIASNCFVKNNKIIDNLQLHLENRITFTSLNPYFVVSKKKRLYCSNWSKLKYTHSKSQIKRKGLIKENLQSYEAYSYSNVKQKVNQNPTKLSVTKTVQKRSFFNKFLFHEVLTRTKEGLPKGKFCSNKAFLSRSFVINSNSIVPVQASLYQSFAEKDSLQMDNKAKLRYPICTGNENNLLSNLSVSEWFTTKPINGALREFFSSSPLSQYMDQTNPLAEVTHKRRLSSLGIGGVSRESAGMTIRGIHPTHYGRICPIETPEGKNAGLVNSLAFYAKINDQGFIETPYYQVMKGQIQHELGFSFYSARQESRNGLYIAPNDIKQSEKSKLLATTISTVDSIPVRVADNLLDLFKKVSPYQVDCIGISPVQILSVATSLIPFLEHNDANRALMGSNMQRQAVSLMSSERPLVGTGLEARVLAESGHPVQSRVSGFVSNISAHQVVVQRLLHVSEGSVLNKKLTKTEFQLQSLNKTRLSYNFFMPSTTTKSWPTQLKSRQTFLTTGQNVNKAMTKRLKKLVFLSSFVNFSLIMPCNKDIVSRNVLFAKKKVALSPVTHSINTFSRSNQETCLTQKPLVEEGDWVQRGDMLSDCSAGQKGELSVGKNMLIAYIPWQGYNFEDAIVISDRLVKEQLYTSLHIERYTVVVNDFKDKVVDTNEWFTGNLPGVDTRKRSHLQKSGLPRIGTILREGDILVGKIKYSKKKPATPHEKLVCDILGEHNFSVQNTSLYVPKGVHEARVLAYKIKTRFGGSEVLKNNLRPAGAPKVVHLFLGEKRNIQVGDKMSGRHGNKGIVSTILPKQDMPYLADGSPIDILLNPLGVPSRMNVGQVFECLLGLASTYLHQNFKVTAFDELYGVEASQSLVFLKLYQARLQSGQNWLFQVNFPGKTRLTDGRSGECLDQWITVGRAYMLKLIHMVNEKIHARAIGPYALVTQQPLKGRAHKGGQRLGEMEVWAVEGFGAAYILQELLTKKSDDSVGRKEVLKAMLPRSTSDFLDPFGQMLYRNPASAITNGLDNVSTTHSKQEDRVHNEDETFTVLGQPDIFKVLICELQALCLDVGVYSIKTESFQRQFVGVFE